MLFFLLSFLSFSFENSETPIILTDKNFSTIIKEIPIAFIFLLKKNISFCTEALPSFYESSKMLKGQVQFVIMDCDDSKKTFEKYGFNAYPSYFIFRKGQLSVEYTYERETLPIVQYLTRISGKDVISIDNGRDLRDFLDAQIHAVVLAAEDIDPELLNTYTQVAIRMKDLVPFVVVVDPDAIEMLNVETNPIIQLYRNQDRKVLNLNLSDEFSAASLETWITENLRPRYRARDSVVFRDLWRDQRYTLLAFVDSTKKKSLDLLHKIMNDVVDEFNENFTYVYCDIYDMGNLVLNLGFLGTHDPCFAIVKLVNGEVKEKHLLSDKYDATPRRVLNFVRKFYNNTINKPFKSEEIPEVQTGTLNKLVGHTFVTELTKTDSDKVVLLMATNNTDNVAAYDNVQSIADEFKKQKIRTVNFYYIDLEKNDIPLKLPANPELNPEIVIWPMGKDQQPSLIHGNSTKLEISSYIMSLGKSKFKFKVPIEYQMLHKHSTDEDDEDDPNKGKTQEEIDEFEDL